MRKYEIWVEGFITNGGNGGAWLHSVQNAESFELACEKALSKDSNFNKNQLTLWGCQLYDNEEDARKLFG